MDVADIKSNALPTVIGEREPITIVSRVQQGPAGTEAIGTPGGGITVDGDELFLTPVASNTLMGNNTVDPASPFAISVAQVRSLLSIDQLDNTADVDKPVPTATQTALNLKANLAGALFSGVVAFIAGTVALPGAAFAGDLDTGMWSPAANTLAVTAGGTGVQRWGVGTSTLTGHLLNGTDATYDLGASGANRFRDAFISRGIYAGSFLGFDSNNYWTMSASYMVSRVNGGDRAAIGPSGQLAMRSDGILQWSSTTSPYGTADLTVYRDAANTLALRNSTNAQTLNIYRTYTDALNYERLSVAYSGAFNILSEAAGTGVIRDVRIGAGSGGGVYLRSGGTDRWIVYSTGVLNPGADATYDLASAALQIRDAYLSRYLKIGGAAPAGASGLSVIQAFGTGWATIGGDVLTDATTKSARWGVLHYTNTEKPLTVFYGASTSLGSTVAIGGGTSSGNAATLINFYTAATTTTATGTTRWQLDGSGHFLPAADNTYNVGYSSARVATVYGVTGDFTGRVHAYSGTAIPAGGTAGAGLRLSSTSNFGVFFGSGAPTLSAAKGSLYLRSDGTTTNDRAYINTDGGTTWTALTTAA